MRVSAACRHHSFPFSSVRCSVGMSLSPRPERPIRMRLPGFSLRVALRARERVRASRSPAGCPRPRSTRAAPRATRRPRRPRSCTRPMLASSACSGPDARIVEAGRDRMRLLDLAVLVLQQQRVAALQHAGRAVRERRRVLPEARCRCRRPRRRAASTLGVAARTDGTGRSRSSRRRRRRPRRRAARPPARASARAPRRRSRDWNSRTMYGYGCGPTAEPSR